MNETVDTGHWLDRLGGRSFPLFVAGILLLVAMFWSSFTHLFVEWQASLYSHGSLVSILFLYYLSKHNASFEPPGYASRVLGLGIVVASCVLLWVSQILAILTLQFAFIYGVVFGFAMSLWGFKAIWQMKYIFIALALTVPVWQVFQPLLRVITTDVSHYLLGFIDVPVLREGYYLTLPGGRFLVEEACAGLSFVLTGTSLMFIFAAWFQMTTWVFIRLLLISTVIAIVANWVRVMTIVLVGNATNMQSEIVQDHLMFGWVLFAVMYCPFYWWAVRKHGSEDRAFNGGPRSVKDVSWTHGKSPFFVGVAAMLGVFALNIWLSSPIAGGAISTPSISALGGEIILKSKVRWGLEIKGIDAEQFRSVSINGDRATVFIAESNDPSKGESIIKSDNVYFNPMLWSEVEKDNQSRYSFLRIESSSRGQRGIAYSYLVGGQLIADWKAAKLQYLKSYFARDDAIYLVAVMTESRSKAGVDKQFTVDVLERTAQAILNR